MSRLLNENGQPKHVLLTGASRGIGVHIAQALAGEGFRLSLVARSSDGPVSYTHLTLPTTPYV